MPLKDYHRKRDFTRTPEPAGDHRDADERDGTGPSRSGRFVVQRHRATRLHYDFRLEIEGVLVSWAVPKGPTLDSAIRRMAVHVEDHPIEYFDFEGVIPARQYGAGDVIVWDWGTWEGEAPTLDGRKAIEDGELKFILKGEKLRGRFTIVRTGGRRGAETGRPFEDDSEQWLLIHKRGPESTEGWDAEDFPASVKTGRTNDEVKANKDAIWISQAPAGEAEIDLSRAREARMPNHVEPMLATLTSKAFDDPDWLFEIKWDGFRVQAVVRDGDVRLFTRNLKDAETYFGRLLSPPSWIDAREAIVDGEVVALDENGAPDFSLLQERISELRAGGRRTSGPLVYQPFDLLYYDGRSLLEVPLESRKRLLKTVLREHPRVRFASHVDANGLAFHAAAQERGLEGIVAKLRTSRYEPGRRSSAWLKIKIRPEQELVVGGWTPGEGNARDLGALAIGVYEDGALRYSGKVGSGFTGVTRKRLLERLAPLVSDDPPFDPPPERKGELRNVTWVRPELVIRAELGGWSRDNLVRQTSFKGIEEGRDPTTVVRERAVETGAAVEAAEASAVPQADDGGPPMPRSSATPKTGSPEHPWAATKEELEALDGLGKEGVWRVGGQDLKLTNLDKAAVPAARRLGRGADHEAGADPLLRPDRPDDPAAPGRPAAEPEPLPERRRRPQLLAEGPAGHGAGLAEPLGRNRGRGARGSQAEHPPARRSGRHDVLARQPGGVRDPRVDVEEGGPVAADLRARRHRSGRQDDLGGDRHPRAAVSDRVRAPRRPCLPEAHRQARHPGLDPGRARQVRVLGHERVGGEGVEGGRRDGA